MDKNLNQIVSKEEKQNRMIAEGRVILQSCNYIVGAVSLYLTITIVFYVW